MKLFERLYDRTVAWSSHPLAERYLAAMSFAESSFFPIPPDVMLVPMSLSVPNKAMRYAIITTVASVLGGCLGYLIGSIGLAVIMPYLSKFGYLDSYNALLHWFDSYGLWVVFAAGFSPFPYKIVTITAGGLHVLFLPFIVASAIGRGARFFLVSFLVARYGAGNEPKIKQSIEVIGWSIVALLAIAFVAIKFW